MTKPKRKWLKAIVLTVVAALLFVAGYAGVLSYLIYSDLSDVERVELVLPEEERPEPLPSVEVAGEDGPKKPLTFLIAGVDKDFTGEVEKGSFVPGAQRSDTILIAHLSADRESVSVVSIPRDTLVEIPGVGTEKINAAYSYGGPSLLVRTVEKFTGIRTDHLVIIDWAGFKALTDSLGGVTVTIPETVYDAYQNRTWEKGKVTLQGDDALAYVRQRHGLPRGDLDRIARQQNFMRLLLGKTLKEGLASPMSAASTVNALVGYVTVDEELSVSEMVSIAIDARELRVSDISFATIPMDRFDYYEGQSVIIASEERTEELFDAVKDEKLDAWLKENPNQALAKPGQVS